VLSDVVDLWKQQDEEAKSRCAAIMESDTNSLICSYAWVIGKGTGMQKVEQLSPVINSVLSSSDGWAVLGKPGKNPRTGWYANQANATFEIRVPIAQVPIHFLTIVAMKSYGPSWVGSKLEIKTTILRPSEAAATTKTNPFNVATFEVDGYHEIKTSVHFPNKFRLPGNGASVGDVVMVEARLIGGSVFKINGIALCRF